MVNKFPTLWIFLPYFIVFIKYFISFLQHYFVLFFIAAFRKCETVQDCQDISHMPDLICKCINNKCRFFEAKLLKVWELLLREYINTTKEKYVSLTRKESNKFTLS